MEEPSPQPGAWPRPRGPAPRPHRDLNAGGSFPKAPRLLPTSAQLRLVLQPHTAGQGPCQAPGPSPPRPHRPDASSETRTQGPGRAQKPPLPLPLSHHGAGRQTLTDTRSYGSPRAGRQGRAGCTRGARCLGPAPRGSSLVTQQVSLLAASECSEVRIVYLTFTCPFFFFFLLLLLYPFQFSEGKSSHVLWVSETPPRPAAGAPSVRHWTPVSCLCRGSVNNAGPSCPAASAAAWAGSRGPAGQGAGAVWALGERTHGTGCSKWESTGLDAHLLQ